MKFDKIILVTGNKNKAHEVGRILNVPIEVRDLDLDEIQELDLNKIALHKLNQAFEIVKAPVLIDDVSMEIDAWNNFPGPLIKWMLKAADGDASVLLKMLGDEKNRKAIAKLAIGFHDSQTPHVFIGEASGSIATEIKGKNGFGWDPVFIPDGSKLSYAEIDPKDKDLISHRGKALAKFRDFLKDNYEI